ncbi:TonB-linked SusC/RagA family outer membrane protein [Salegentibacter sp. 24]|jgi:TonB-linked SusC/RagA family outer membrane protein|uniref:SusC/RagA family TonB-linked outer membrane protein n=1 Tax=Salegentibacter sp. 24 TaxID=2183986 RepID=UPI0010620315|nr:SusC/RagA family TonB-linked outer membrane protein [Salegentibacter sp. 24]TDN95674.1 TonB-linked SusC/RagA family outer membrane protein [Salegentibacter sp. 24]
MGKKLLFLLGLMFFSFNQNLIAQDQTVTGTVTDSENGMPLPGVTVLEKGTNNGTSTDFDGNYSLSVSEDAILVFSMVGFMTKEEPVDGRTNLNLQLSPDTEALDEVVVTSLGLTREKKSLGYAVTQLDSEEVNTVKDYNVANSLVGKVAGLVVNQSSGVGSGSRITIRGNNTLTGNNQALIVVDGIPIDASGNESGGSIYNSTVTGGGITDINPADIESISVLKGPNAAALYGSRAASGVILITTKKGTRGAGLGISLNSNISIEETMFLPELQNQYGQGTNGAVYADLENFGSGSWGPQFDGSQQLYYTGEERAYVAQPDNVENFFENGVKSINSIAMDQGGENYSVRFSYTNNQTTSVIPNSELHSHNFNLRGVIDLSDKLTLDSKATYFTQELENRVNVGTEGVLAYVYSMPRNTVIEDLKRFKPSLWPNPEMFPDEYGAISYAGQNKSIGNPYWMLSQDTNDERRDRFFGFSKLNYEFNDWLSAFIRIGGDVTNVRAEFIQDYGHHFFYDGRLNFSTTKNVELNSDFLFTADKDITEKLNLVANVGGSLSKRTFEGMSVSGSQFRLPSRAFLNNTNVQTSTHTPLGMKKINSLYGAFSFSYDDFMYLDITGRNDWSSTLSEDNRSFFYPSVSYSLLINRFIDPDKNIFDMLKLRASWAEVGNDTDVYQLYQTFSVPQQGYLGLTVLEGPSVKLNPDLKPESVRSTEFGVEFNMFKNRLYGNFSIYEIVTKDMIFNVPVPFATGYSFFKENVGEVKNNGFEIMIGGVPIRNENFRWDVSANLSRNNNELVELIDGLDYTTLNTLGNLSIRAEVGGGIGDIYGTTWKTNESGELLVNAEGFPVASNERVKLGNAQPDFIGGLSNNFSYKNWNFRFLIDGRFGGEIYSATSSYLDAAGVSERSLQYREDGIVVDAINEGTGEQNDILITAQQYWNNYSNITSNYVYDQTNVRLREFSLTYGLPGEAIDKIGFTSASIGLIGRNLFFIYKAAEDIDPDTSIGTGLSGQGISLNNAPTIRSLGLNINIKF